MSELARLRARIEALDDQLVDLLAARADLVGEIWAHKEAAGVPRLDQVREAAEIERMAERALDRGLDPDGVREVAERVVGRDLRAARRSR